MNTQIVTTKTVKKNVPKKKKNKRSKRSRVVSPQLYIAAPQLSACAKAYLRVCVNPFGNFGKNMPCIPDAIAVPSKKIKVTVRGTAVAGGGTGYVIYNPWLAIVNDGGLSGTLDSFPVTFTTSAYASGEAYFRAVAAGAYTTAGLLGVNSNSPYTTANFTSNLWAFRLVGAGMRVKFIGDNFHNSGRTVLFRDENQSSIQSGTQVSTMLADMYTNTIPHKQIPASGVSITFLPTGWQANSYALLTNFNQFSPNAGKSCLMCFFSGGDTTTAQSFEFECVSFYEIVGRNLDTTPSESDALGHGAVTSAISQVIRAPVKPPEVVEQTLLQTATNYLSNQISNMMPSVADFAGRTIGSAAKTYFSGGSFNPNIPRISLGGPTVTEL